MRRETGRGIGLILILTLTGCTTAAQHYESLPATKERKVTVGIVQKEIRYGMTQAQVAEILGSPNIVTSDGPGKETWIYDKISTDVAYSTSSGGLATLLIGGGGNVAGGVAPGYSQGSGAITRTERTLTVIIRFRGGKVYDFAYHATRF